MTTILGTGARAPATAEDRAEDRGEDRAEDRAEDRSDDRSDDLSDALAAGTLLGRYEIVRLIGYGGMGHVYEARHRDLGKQVAIKTLLPALAASADARLRFLREGQAASRMRHPHIVDVTDVVADGPTSYLVMEYLEGEDLAARLARQGPLAVVEVADTLLPVMAAIAEAHGQGVIHRDLKPENVFLARSAYGGACPKVLDFGISKVLGDAAARALTGTSATFGTVYYLPPEQLRGAREADARSDQYALGTILYECLTGRRAFDGDNVYAILKSVAEGEHVPARALRPDLPAPLDAAIRRAMCVDPAGRFASVRELGAALLEFASPSVRAFWASAFADASGEAPGAHGTTTAGATRTMVLPSLAAIDSKIEVIHDVIPRRSPVGSIVVLAVAVVAAAAIATGARVAHRRRATPPVEADGASPDRASPDRAPPDRAPPDRTLPQPVAPLAPEAHHAPPSPSLGDRRVPPRDPPPAVVKKAVRSGSTRGKHARVLRATPAKPSQPPRPVEPPRTNAPIID